MDQEQDQDQQQAPAPAQHPRSAAPPAHILAKLFDYLSFPELMSKVRPICNDWNQQVVPYIAANRYDPKLASWEGEKKNLDIAGTRRVLACSGRNPELFSKCIIGSVQSFAINFDLIQYYGFRLREATFDFLFLLHDPQMKEDLCIKILEAVFARCTNLRVLQLWISVDSALKRSGWNAALPAENVQRIQMKARQVGDGFFLNGTPRFERLVFGGAFPLLLPTVTQEIMSYARGLPNLEFHIIRFRYPNHQAEFIMQSVILPFYRLMAEALKKHLPADTQVTLRMDHPKLEILNPSFPLRELGAPGFQGPRLAYTYVASWKRYCYNFDPDTVRAVRANPAIMHQRGPEIERFE